MTMILDPEYPVDSRSSIETKAWDEYRLHEGRKIRVYTIWVRVAEGRGEKIAIPGGLDVRVLGRPQLHIQDAYQWSDEGWLWGFWSVALEYPLRREIPELDGNDISTLFIDAPRYNLRGDRDPGAQGKKDPVAPQLDRMQLIELDGLHGRRWKRRGLGALPPDWKSETLGDILPAAAMKELQKLIDQMNVRGVLPTAKDILHIFKRYRKELEAKNVLPEYLAYAVEHQLSRNQLNGLRGRRMWGR